MRLTEQRNGETIYQVLMKKAIGAFVSLGIDETH